MRIKAVLWKWCYIAFSYKPNGRPYTWCVVPEPYWANRLSGFLYGKWLSAEDSNPQPTEKSDE